MLCQLLVKVDFYGVLDCSLLDKIHKALQHDDKEASIHAKCCSTHHWETQMVLNLEEVRIVGG